MKYAEMEPYRGNARHALIPTFCVGWLDGELDFHCAEVDEYVLPVIWQLCRRVVAVTRGPAGCPLCRSVRVVTSYQDDMLLLGMGEIRVFDGDRAYASPDLIFHYIAEHGYCPPPSFVAALLGQPMPWTGAYARLLGRGIE